MKVYQIISERKQLNEFVPILAGLTVAGVIQAVGVAMTAWSIYDIYKFIGKYNKDPAAISDAEWGDLWIDVILLAIPVAAKLGKPAVVKMLPESVVAKGGKWMKTRVVDLIAKKGGAKAAEKGADTVAKAATKEIKVGKYTFQVTKAAEEAGRKKFLGLSPIVQDILKWGVTAEFAVNYMMQIWDLEDQYQKCIAGDKTTKIFGDDSKEAAYAHAKQIRTKLLGEVVVGVGVSLGVTSKAVGLIGSLGKWITTAVTGSATAGRVVASPATLGAWLIKLAEGGPLRNAALLAFLQTPYGKQFLETSVVELITDTVGGVTAATLDLGVKAMSAVGVEVPAAVKTKITDPRSPEDQAAAADPATNVQKNPTNPKIVYVNGVQVSDANGYQAIGDKMMNDIRADAAALGKPDPTAGIKKDPKKKYDYYGVN